MVRPGELQTNETLQFVLESVPFRGARVLEVGCGNGELANKLRNLGYEVIAIDSSERNIEDARRLGVDARVAEFPDFEEDRFDVILFTRSLHHIRPLQPALNQAHHLIKPSGLMVVEDFAYSDTNEYTAAWFYRTLKLLEACGVLLPAEDSFGRKLLKGGGDISLWRDHVHEINTAQEVLDAIGQCFEVLKMKLAPYLYRYASQMVQDDDRGGRIVSRLLELEKETGSRIDHFLIGRRFVAQR
jgi:2-polyprenyl-3-methyl-5-hydroxy-6-metoxy-1,4-benzoquinol methylase